MTSLFYDKCHFELSIGDAIMDIAVSFSLRYASNTLIMSCQKGVFKTPRPLFTELSHFISFFKHFSAT